MNKKLYCYFFFLLISSIGFSQNVSLSIVSAQGGFDKTENISLEWTLGESFIETANLQNEIYTQGFHQPFLNNKLELQDQIFDILISPNPVYSHINISVSTSTNSQLIISLYDIYGRYIKQISAFTTDSFIELNVIGLSTGTYILKISDLEGSVIQSHKIIKY